MESQRSKPSFLLSRPLIVSEQRASWPVRFYLSPRSVISTLSADPIQRILLHLISTRPRVPVFLPSMNSSVSLNSTFMYESMLSNVPLYSVWPHLRRIISSVPTLACKKGLGFTGWKLMLKWLSGKGRVSQRFLLLKKRGTG